MVAEWEEHGGRGCIFAVRSGDPSGYVEIYDTTAQDSRYHLSFGSPIENDKVDLQLRTASVDSWVERLHGAWPFEGPQRLPWGQRWITLRDPDGLLIAIYEGEV
jgi:hypothetical protein